jgi:hypothetical protein
MSLESIPTAAPAQPENAFDLFDLQDAAEGNPDLEALFESVEQGVHDYYDRTLEYRKISKQTTNKDTEQTDQAKRLTHNALISSLTALARNAKKAGKDTAWWDGPGGFCKGTFVDRHVIAAWAVKEASKYLQKDLLERF